MSEDIGRSSRYVSRSFSSKQVGWHLLFFATEVAVKGTDAAIRSGGPARIRSKGTWDLQLVLGLLSSFEQTFLVKRCYIMLSGGFPVVVWWFTLFVLVFCSRFKKVFLTFVNLIATLVGL